MAETQPLELKGRVALVTGAGSGIGKAAAILLAQEGARVGALDLKMDELKELQDEVGKQGLAVTPLEADISSPEAMQRAVEKLVDAYGRLDIVFANAGINGVWAPIDELTPEDWTKTITNNLTGTFLTVKYAAPFLKRQGGSVIVTASVNGTRIFSNTGATAYSTSKAGQVAMTKMLALELAKYRVRVNVICPGAITTNISQSTEHRDTEREKEPVEYPEGEIPLTRGEPGTAEQVAKLVLFLASDASNHISGAEIFIDGAESLLVG